MYNEITKTQLMRLMKSKTNFKLVTIDSGDWNEFMVTPKSVLLSRESIHNIASAVSNKTDLIALGISDRKVAAVHDLLQTLQSMGYKHLVVYPALPE